MKDRLIIYLPPDGGPRTADRLQRWQHLTPFADTDVVTASATAHCQLWRNQLFPSDRDREFEHTGGNLDDFLVALPRNMLGRDREEIAAQVEAERASWDL
jgi:hypothetical protein